MIRLVVILLLIFSGGSGDIAKVNRLKKNAEIAYKSGQYDVAISNYSYLQDSMDIDDDRIALNLGHAYYQTKQMEFAESQYKKLIDIENEAIKSIAYQQLGVLSNDPKTLENALTYFKAALKADPSNEDARYNYELIKKKLRDQNQDQDQQDQDQDQKDENEEDKDKDKENEDQEEQDQEDQEKEDQEQQDEEGKESEDQENQDQQDQQDQDSEEKESEEEQESEDGEPSEEEQEEQDQQQQEGEEGDEQEEEEQQQPGEESEEEPSEEERKEQQQQMTEQKLEEMNISEEKAKMILEALKNSEVQYIQQNRRQPTQSKDSDKPDW
ncbi:MAG: hypothetical protein OCD76_21640 [Reichenbachiella sp.]